MGKQLAAPVIRPAREEDLPSLTTLCGQLGYPSSRDEVAQRLPRILADTDSALFVAETPGGEVIGWVHVFVRHLLVVNRHAELGGLVVNEAQHGSGVGRLLMLAVERWAKEQGCETIFVRSNVIRQEAHQFYEHLGYENFKTSFSFRKTFGGEDKHPGQA